MSGEKFGLPPREWVEAEARRHGVTEGQILDELLKAHERSETALVSDELLKGLAAQAFNMAKLDIERRQFNFLLASYHAGEALHRMRLLEMQIVQRLGAKWLNSGATKDAAFHVMRLAVKVLPPDAILFGSVMNQFKPTAKFHALPEEEQRKLVDASHDRHHEAVAAGLLELSDALSVVAQTPFRVCFYVQTIDRRGAPIGPPDSKIGDQGDFAGRLKLYGDEEVEE